MIELKHCPRCGKDKPLSDFGKSNQTKTGKNCWCLECCREAAKEYRQTPAGIYLNIKSRQKYFKKKGSPKAKPFEITKTYFIKWYNEQPKKCAYCDIPEDKINLPQNYFSRKRIQLGVDCKDNKLGYVEGNLVLCCNTCNIVKSGVFSFDEFREIAQKYLKPKWIKKIIKV